MGAWEVSYTECLPSLPRILSYDIAQVQVPHESWRGYPATMNLFHRPMDIEMFLIAHLIDVFGGGVQSETGQRLITAMLKETAP
jgi:hypothetical protein